MDAAAVRTLILGHLAEGPRGGEAMVLDEAGARAIAGELARLLDQPCLPEVLAAVTRVAAELDAQKAPAAAARLRVISTQPTLVRSAAHLSQRQSEERREVVALAARSFLARGITLPSPSRRPGPTVAGLRFPRRV